jgi:hypothetical protein
VSPTRAPLRVVVSSRRGPGCQHVNFPAGVAIVCGPRPFVDTLSCGHVVTTEGKRARQRRCPECLAEGRLL